MPPFLRLSILPIIGCLLLLAAFIWGRRELKLTLSGKPAEGQLIGMVLQRGEQADVISAIDTVIVLTRADGERIKADYANYALLASSTQPAGMDPTDASAPRSDQTTQTDPGIPASATPWPANVRKMLDDVVRGDAEIVRWALLRENRRSPDASRVVRVEKTEIVRGYFDVPKVPEIFGLREGNLLLNKDDVASPLMGSVRIQAVFDVSDPARVSSQKGDSLMEYSYERNGKIITPAKRNFILSAEPYSTQFRPVFAFDVNGRAVARLSHIGRHGGPTLALRLYAPCRVYYDPARPEEAVVTALPGPVGDDPLGWFSRLCEGLFGQWGSTALIAIAGLLYIVTGLIFISLSIFPSRNIPGLTESSASD